MKLETDMHSPAGNPPKSDMPRRILCYVLGLFILALGVSFSVKSNLGISPVSSLPYVLGQIFGLDMGLVTALLFTSYVLLQIPLLGRQFQLKNLLQVIVGVLFGSFVSVTNQLVFFGTPESYLLRVLLIACSILLVGLGVFLVLAADIAPQPPEGLMLAIEKRTGWKFAKIKIGFDCTTVGLAIVLSLLCFKELRGVREGTVISALLVGVAIAQYRKWLGKPVDRLLLRQPVQQPEQSPGQPPEPPPVKDA